LYYYVFKDNLAKAKAHFKDVPRMLQAFEHWFWTVSFWTGYKLVDTLFRNGTSKFSGLWGSGFKMDIVGSRFKWKGTKFDFIIHEVRRHEVVLLIISRIKIFVCGFMSLLIILKFIY
jgi:hypothetical protein